MRWVSDNLNDQNPKTAFCASGNSNGAAAIAYAMAQYGLADIFSAVELDGGPAWARVDQACVQDDPAYQSLWYDQNGRQLTDWSFGNTSGNGPCFRQDVNFRQDFAEASVVYSTGKYVYPNTLIWFLFGALDTTVTKAHGLYFYDWLLKAGSPLVRMDIVPDTDHIVAETAEGANRSTIFS